MGGRSVNFHLCKIVRMDVECEHVYNVQKLSLFKDELHLSRIFVSFLKLQEKIM